MKGVRPHRRKPSEALNSADDQATEPSTAAFLFDLDGTLIDSTYEHVLSWREALRGGGLGLPAYLIHRCVGMSGKLMLRSLLADRGLTEQKIEDLEASHKEHFSRRLHSLQVLPGAQELLHHLSKTETPWAIGTSGDKATVQRMIKPLKVPRSSPVVTGEDVRDAKPEPDIFREAAKRLRVKLSNCIVVGDSVWDLLAAKRARALGVGLLSGGYGRQELESAGAYRVYQDAGDLLAHLVEVGLPDSGSSRPW